MLIETKQPQQPLSKTDWGIAALIWLLAFSLYWRTLAPSLLWGDSAEFQTLSYTLGMTHPSGYMTQIMFGRLFTLMPLGNIAYRVNLMSAFFGALAVALVFLILRVLGNRRAAALAACALMALMENFWSLAVVAESYTVSAGMIASVWLLVLLWQRTENWKYLFAAGMLGGLSIGIHSTVVMTGAAVLVYMALTAQKKSAWLGAAAGALLGVALTVGAFLYVDAHDPPSSIYNTVYRPALGVLGLTQNDFNTPFKRFFAIFPANHFWTYYFSAAPDVMRARLGEYLLFFPTWALILIFVGMVAIFFRSRWYDGLYPLIGFLLIWGLGVTVEFSIYREFYVPATVMIGVWLGAGTNLLLDGLDALAQRFLPADWMRRFGLGCLSLALILLPLWHARADLNLAIQKGYTNFIRRDHIYPIQSPDASIQNAKKIINRLEPHAIVFTDWDRLYSLVYTSQIVMGRTDLAFHETEIIKTGRLADSIMAYINANIDSHPVYFTVMLDGLEENYRVQQIDDGFYRIYKK